MPLLNIKLRPSRALPGITVSYYWPKASGRILEKEVTSRLEGAFNSIKGVRELKSKSSALGGNVEISFNKSTDMDMARFEVATLIRQVYPELPYGVTYPSIRLQSGDNERRSLMVYTLNGSASSFFIQQYAQENIVPRLSLLKGVRDIQVYGSTPYEWEVCYHTQVLKQMGISSYQVQKAVNDFFSRRELGGGWEISPSSKTSLLLQVYYSFKDNKEFKPQKIPVCKVDDRIIYLDDVATVRYKEQEPSGYFRINGLNTINLVVTADKTANQLDLANSVRERIDEMKISLPPGFSILQSYDATEFIQKELDKIAWRTGLSLLILLLFVLLISRQWRYLILIVISLVVNLSIAAILYYLMELEIHLYAMAGITVSLGMILDNSIVMIDHLRVQKNRRAFLAILAATLTTIGSLSVIFFLGEEQKLKLIDFAWVMIINLAVSLVVALFLIPSLMEKIPLRVKRNKLFFRRKRRVVKITHIYEIILIFMQRWRWAFFVLAVLAFGLPVYNLPEKMEGDGFWDKAYNKTLGSYWYQDNIKEKADILLGGTLRLFSQNVYDKAYYSEPSRTKLVVTGQMPEGGTLVQLNESMQLMENYLSQFDEIDQFQSSIYNPRNGRIQILFKPEAENSSFPFQLKNQITDKAINMGGMDWGVYGVGRGFSNALGTGYRNSRITLYGYNYEQLYGFASELRSKLLLNSRIKEADIVGRSSWGSQSKHEYRFRVDPGLMAASGTDYGQIYGYLREVLGSYSPRRVMIDGRLQPIHLISDQKTKFDLWKLRNMPISINDNTLKLGSVATVKKERSGNDIYKKNQEYQLVVEYDFIGPSQLSKMVRDDHVKYFKERLPLGYRVEKTTYGNWWSNEDSASYWLILLVMGIIYFICAIVLESLWQPLAVISMIPLSFIGVFLTFYLFDLNFDQGGYASFILLCGISVNAALYIINDRNNLRRMGNGMASLKLYLKAYNHKIVPIMLTILSTILGLIPFLVAGQNEVFWFALAAGTIGGLIFSLVAIVLFLPLWMKKGELKNVPLT